MGCARSQERELRLDRSSGNVWLIANMEEPSRENHDGDARGQNSKDGVGEGDGKAKEAAIGDGREYAVVARGHCYLRVR